MRDREARLGCVRASIPKPLLDVLWHDDPGHLVVESQRERVAAHVEDADEERDRARPAEPLEERFEVREVEEDLRHRELRSRLELAFEALELELEVVRGGIDCDAEEERCRRVDLTAVEVLARVHARDDLSEPDRVDLVYAACARIVARFRSVWQQASLGTFLKNSAIVASGTVILSLVIAAMGGYAFSQLHWRGRQLAYYFVLAFLAVPPVALLVPIYDEMNRLGLIDTYWSVILLYTALGTPFNVYLMTSYLRSINAELIEAARMDGAGTHAIFREVILPLAKPPLATLAIFNFLFAWNEFIFALLLLQSDSVKTATVGVLQLQGRYSTTYPTLAAGLLIISLPVIGIYLFFQRYLVRAIVAGGVK